MILSTILLAAAEAVEHEKSEAPFFVAGALLVTYAIVISVMGMKKPDFPADVATARGVMGLGATLVAATAIAIVYVST
jgi:quinol-cytochrome oxidoreductase complex cytochrome b subunit